MNVGLLKRFGGGGPYSGSALLTLYKCFPLHLKIQCKKYRSMFTEEKKAIYEEKLDASKIFKGKKALYPSRYEQAFTL